jgi:hypothetical protein
VVRGEDDHTLVEALNPQTMVQLTGRKELQPVAEEATQRLTAALKSLAG